MNHKRFVVMVARNNLHLTKLAVKSALAQDPPCKVIVLDNASSDGTVNWLRTKPEVIFAGYQNAVRSLAECWNDLISHAFMNQGCSHVLVINNDSQIRSDCYSQLYGWSETYNIPFVTGIAVGSPHELREGEPATTFRPHPDFSCFMIRRDCWETVGRFNESFYPAFCEDCDYHVRMHRAGIQAVGIDLPYIHHHGATLKYAPPSEQAAITRGAHTNRELFRSMYGCYPGTPEYDLLFK